MRSIALVPLCLFLAASASAQQGEDKSQPRPQALSRVLDCRALQAEAERLACFDREVAALEQAATARDIVVYDREQVRKTRRTLFGIALPDLNLFGGGDDDDEDAEEFNQIESVIRGVSQDNQGRYTLTLEDGARWAQIDNRDLPILPRAGHSIKIRRAAMGSYLANVANQAAIRVRRIMPGT